MDFSDFHVVFTATKKALRDMTYIECAINITMEQEKGRNREIMARAESIAVSLCNIISEYQVMPENSDMKEAIVQTLADALFHWQIIVLAEEALKGVNTDEDARHWSFDHPAKFVIASAIVTTMLAAVAAGYYWWLI